MLNNRVLTNNNIITLGYNYDPFAWKCIQLVATEIVLLPEENVTTLEKKAWIHSSQTIK